MENFDLLKLYKKAINNVTNTKAEDEPIKTTQKMETSAPIYTVVSASDVTMIDGKEVDAFGTLTDEDIEQGLSVRQTNSASKIIDLDRYKGFSADIISKIKNFIYNHKPSKPNSDGDINDDDNNNNNVDDDYNNNQMPGGGYRPDLSSDGTDGTGPSMRQTWLSPDDDITAMERGSNASLTLEKGETRYLNLTDPFGANIYQYKISTDSDSENVQFEYLENGRLVIRGNNLNIEANKNQKDDIILLGNGNTLNTGDGNDIVRVGEVRDSDTYYKIDSITDYYAGDMYAAKENKIYTGSGDDYVYMHGYNFTLDGGNGNDKILYTVDPKEFSDVTNNISDVQIERTSGLKDLHYQDGNDGWSMQGNVGDCRLFSLINSLCGTRNNGDLTNYVDITPINNGWQVKFKNYKGSNDTATITQAELDASENSFGDVDTLLVDLAMNKLIAANNDLDNLVVGGEARDTSVANAYYNTIAKYMLGNDMVSVDMNNYVNGPNVNFKNNFEILWEDYKNGKINNFTVGLGFNDENTTEDYKLGIIGGHAYAVRDYVKDSTDEYNNIRTGYVELVNPWDDADCLKLPLDMFFNELYVELVIYGYNVFDEDYYWPNGGDAIDKNQSTASSSNLNLSNLTTRYMADGNDDLQDEIQTVEKKVTEIKSLLFNTKKIAKSI